MILERMWKIMGDKWEEIGGKGRLLLTFEWIYSSIVNDEV